MGILIILILTQAALATSTLEVEEAKKALTALIRPLLKGESGIPSSKIGQFQLNACDKHKIDWMNVLLMKEEAKLTYRFAPGCDVEGSLYPRIFQDFPVDLKLRNLESYHRLTSLNKITANLQERPILNLEVTSGILTGTKGQVKFNANYQVQINPLQKENPIEKNLGGEIRITEIYGKQVLIKEKILIKN